MGGAEDGRARPGLRANVAVGEPFNYGITSFAAMPGPDSRGAAQAAPAQQVQHNSATG